MLDEGPAISVLIEAEMRLPWRGGTHPWLDVAVRSGTHLIGIESKRYEPFRSKSAPRVSAAYARPVWPEGLVPWRDTLLALREGALGYRHLDAAQLCKHALGLATQAGRDGLEPALIYLHAEPAASQDGRIVPAEAIAAHREELADFTARVASGALRFAPLTWRDLLARWQSAPDPALAGHAGRVQARFSPL